MERCCMADSPLEEQVSISLVATVCTVNRSLSNDGSLLLHHLFFPSFTKVSFIAIIESVSLSDGSSFTDPRLVHNPLYCSDSPSQAVTRSNGSIPMDEGYISSYEQGWKLISKATRFAGFSIEELIATSDQSYGRIISNCQ